MRAGGGSGAGWPAAAACSAIWRPSAIDRRDLVVGQRLHPLLALHRRLDVGRELLGLALHALGFVLLELAHHLAGEQLERLADVLVPVAAALLDEGHLVDAALVELAQVLAQPSGVPMPPSAVRPSGPACSAAPVWNCSQMSVRPGICSPKP